MENLTVKRLAEFSLFDGLDEKRLAKVAGMFSQARFEEGSDIIVEGQTGSEMFLLLQGEIIITKRLTLYSSGVQDQREKSLVRLSGKNNVFFGEMSIFDIGERSATVTAMTEVLCGTLNRDQITVLCESDPFIGYKIFFNIGKVIAGNLRRSNRDVLKLTTAFCMALERA